MSVASRSVESETLNDELTSKAREISSRVVVVDGELPILFHVVYNTTLTSSTRCSPGLFAKSHPLAKPLIGQK